MPDLNEKQGEVGRVLAPDISRPSEEEITALAYEFWKARGCPEWLWGGLRKRVVDSRSRVTPALRAW